MDIPIHDTDGHPQVVGDEEDLFFFWAGLVHGQDDHAFFCIEGGGGGVPREVWLGGVGFRELFHAGEGRGVFV